MNSMHRGNGEKCTHHRWQVYLIKIVEHQIETLIEKVQVVENLCNQFNKIIL
jgi:hypothetical protein